MKPIFENRDYKAATEQLTQLLEARATAALEENTLLAQLNAHQDLKLTALDRAKVMLGGGAPAPRTDLEGLSARLTACRASLALLSDAIGEQRDIIAGLVSEQSAGINAERKASHIDATRGIRTALAGLRAALEVEQGLRDGITAAGYQCSLEPMACPELSFADAQSSIFRFAHDVDVFLTAHELSATKTMNVRLLFGTGVDSLPGDVVTVTGIEAARLVRFGRAEPTRDRPHRVARPVRESFGVAMAEAFS